MPPEKKETPTESEASRITTGYAKDFKAKVKVLQARFTGKYRRALYEALKAKGVISADYSTEMWDNDFKAWRKNPNNGIFRHLEMAGAILEEAQIPAFQVFGGPHAKDTDEVVNGISSRVIAYLDSSLEGFKTSRKNAVGASIKRERIINGQAFTEMEKIFDWIEEYFGPWEMQTYPLGLHYFPIFYSTKKGLNGDTNRKYAPFFFLFAWSNFTNFKNDKLNDCVYTLCNKIFNNSFAPYYYAYFSQKFSKKVFLYQDDGKPTGDCEIFLDMILNQALVIAYQLNAITEVYQLYIDQKTVTITEKGKKDLAYSTCRDQSTGEDVKDTDDAPRNPISNMAERTIRRLRISIPEKTGNEKELIETFEQKLKETSSFFCDFTEILEISRLRKMYTTFKKYNGLPLKILETMNVVIKNLQETVKILNTSETVDKKNLPEYYVITEKRKEPIKIKKECYTLVITDSMVNLFDSILSGLKYSMDGMSVQSNSGQAVEEKNQASSLNNQNNEIAPSENQSDNLSQRPQEETQKDQEHLGSPSSLPAIPPNDEIISDHPIKNRCDYDDFSTGDYFGEDEIENDDTFTSQSDKELMKRRKEFLKNQKPLGSPSSPPAMPPSQSYNKTTSNKNNQQIKEDNNNNDTV